MIGLKGRHPKVPENLAKASEAPAKALLTQAKSTAVPVFREEDFPNHWGKHKHHFIRPQYNGKCAYCETHIVSGNPGDVEHFRPKAYCQSLSPAKSRDDYGGQPPGRSNDGPATEGYWWLAYKWSNYLLSCNRCNSSWKRNQFPVAAKRSGRGEKLSAERALLINPFVVDPERHFQFDAITGQIRGLTPQGAATIDVCGLDRRSLEIQRAIKGAKLNKRYREYLSALKQANVLAQNNALSALMDECRSKEPFAAVARCFVKQHLTFSYVDLLAMKRKRQI
ncbi:hypothetical protein J3Q09_12125 [Pseudomonas sp. R4-83]|uniref:hypothetical protein n=1 Tax=unclassified Pseudomonas TaxID=196821 RepID=UPI003DA894A7